MPHTPSPTLQARSIWDIAIWDRNLWADVNTTFKRWFGVSGFGKKMSMQAAVRSNGAVLITDFEVLYETGIGL
jgi:hypothetical protein